MGDHCPFGRGCICGARASEESHWAYLPTGAVFSGSLHFSTDLEIAVILTRPFVTPGGHLFQPGEKLYFRHDTIKEVVVGE